MSIILWYNIIVIYQILSNLYYKKVSLWILKKYLAVNQK